ncbi:M6 family metalloprotease domain-containing protein [Bacillus cereus VD133]|uniref:M6 family metalloprotease domain-containing protein n=1 Tax=Bacillus cereus VD133 TaxID=1053233 RepID=A0A9W5PJR7_BACCE|nr:immune inhibitor A domain-containing protein [Bacillus cereus]EOO24372.1 M6 family metalloprotease domain-containing protein [Bacillus cereus VD133]
MYMYKRGIGVISSMILTTVITITVPMGIAQACTDSFNTDELKQKNTHMINTSTDFENSTTNNLKTNQTSALKTSPSASRKQDTHTDHIAVSLIEFPNMKHNQIKQKKDLYTKDFNKEHYDSMLFKNGIFQTPEGVNMPSMNQFYNEQSGGFWNVKGVISPWMQAKNNIEYYRDFKGDGPFEGFGELVKETLTQVGQSIKGNENLYDQRDLGFLDTLVVVMAGATADMYVTPYSGELKEPVQIPGTTLKAKKYIVVPEDVPVGVIAHEYGHNLGLPDLYDFGGKGSPDMWSLMAFGGLNGQIEGIEPSSFDPWSKMFLQSTYGGNWIKPIELDYNDLEQKKEILLEEAVSKDPSRKVIKVNLPPVMKDGIKYPNYYLIEWRSHNGSDKGLSKSMGVSSDPGMIVWYYDGRYTDNAEATHPGHNMLGVIDAHQQILYLNHDKSKPAMSRFQNADAAFGLRKTTPVKLETPQGNLDYPSQEGVSTFNDQNDYTGKILPKLGLQFKVIKENEDGRGATIEVSKHKEEDSGVNIVKNGK